MGELLIDFTPVGETEDGRLLFARNPGGAPANVAVQAHRAGVSAGFLGRVGLDMFGGFLADTLKGCGVDTRGLSQDPDYATTLAFVQLSPEGDRDFSFYRNPGAGHPPLLCGGGPVHCGGVASCCASALCC